MMWSKGHIISRSCADYEWQEMCGFSNKTLNVVNVEMLKWSLSHPHLFLLVYYTGFF